MSSSAISIAGGSPYPPFFESMSISLGYTKPTDQGPSSCPSCGIFQASLRALHEERRKLEIRIDRLENENLRLKADIDELLKAERAEQVAGLAKTSYFLDTTAKGKVFFVVQICNAVGATTYDIKRSTGLSSGSISARLRELVAEGLVVFSGNYRVTPSGRKAKIWVSV